MRIQRTYDGVDKGVIIKEIRPVAECVGEKLFTDTRLNKTYHSINFQDVVTFENLGFEQQDMPVQLELGGTYRVASLNYRIVLTKIEPIKEKNDNGLQVKSLTDRIEKFFDKSEEYTKRGMFPKRGVLLHGPPGCGKTHTVNTITNELKGKDGLVIHFAMDEMSTSSIREFFTNNGLPEGVKRIFIAIEDLGGTEVPENSGGRQQNFIQDSSLLTFLDGNSIPWKEIPTVIISTTNYPGVFLANLLDRPGRFDEVIEVDYPDGDKLIPYVEAIIGKPMTDFDKKSMHGGNLSISHAREAAIRHLIYDEPIHLNVEKMREYTKNFNQKVLSSLTNVRD